MSSDAWLESLRDRLEAGVWAAARAECDQGGDAADFLFNNGSMGETELVESLSTFYDRPAMFLAQYVPDELAIARIPENDARKREILPLFICRGKLFVATWDPEDLALEDYVRQLTRLPMEAVVTTKNNIIQNINRYYLAGDRSRERVQSMAARSPREQAAAQPPSPPKPKLEVDLEEGSSPAVKLVDYILSTGIRLGASDVHLEACSNRLLLRYRIDGVLREYSPPPFDMGRAMASRIKVLADMDVSERRLPQDGRASMKVDEIDYDLRISIIPNLYGESVVIRILASSAEIKGLKDMGFSPSMLKTYLRLITQPHGVFLVTGPTGSGKSTTLYATLKHIVTPEKKILALEDPVEARLEGVTQFQMNAGIGFTFARCLRSVLRHDPEVVLLGEIRDQETAEIAIRASLTGHMIFSTLHTNDACSAPTRLVDMGVQGYLVMTSLIGVLSQRLVRRLCLRCRRPLEIEPSHLASLGLYELPVGATPYRPVGCAECQNLGYRGRVAIHELLEINTEMRRLKPEAINTENILEVARKGDFATLRDCAVEKWAAGLTSLEEILKLAGEA